MFLVSSQRDDLTIEDIERLVLAEMTVQRGRVPSNTVLVEERELSSGVVGVQHHRHRRAPLPQIPVHLGGGLDNGHGRIQVAHPLPLRHGLASLPPSRNMLSCAASCLTPTVWRR